MATRQTVAQSQQLSCVRAAGETPHPCFRETDEAAVDSELSVDAGACVVPASAGIRDPKRPWSQSVVAVHSVPQDAGPPKSSSVSTGKNARDSTSTSANKKGDAVE